MDKNYLALLVFLVDEQHTSIVAVRGGLDARLGVVVLGSAPYEVLVGADQLAGRERLSGAGTHHETRKARSGRGASAFR